MDMDPQRTAQEQISCLGLGRRSFKRQTYNDVELPTAKIRGKVVGWEKALEVATVWSSRMRASARWLLDP